MESDPESKPEPQNESVDPAVETSVVDKSVLSDKIDEVVDSLIREGLIDETPARVIIGQKQSNVSKLIQLNQLNPSFIELILRLTPGDRPAILGQLYLISLEQVALTLGGGEFVNEVELAARPSPDSTMPNLAGLQLTLGETSEIFTQMALLNMLKQAPETVGPMLMDAMLQVTARLVARGEAKPDDVKLIIESNQFDIDVLEELNEEYPGFTSLVLTQMLGADSAVSDDQAVDDGPGQSKRGFFHRRA